MTKTRVSLTDIQHLTQRALVVHGAAEWVADEVAKAVRKAEENGNLICGLYYLESYCTQLRSGRVRGDVEPHVSQPKTAALKVDAKLGFAQAAFARALPWALEIAENAGTCALGVCHAHTCTSLGYFTEQIAAAGFIGIGFTNASAVVSPPGGSSPVLGTNPIAMSVPGPKGRGDIAFQFDQSTSAVALGKITMAASANEAIPEGWAVDAEGRPTTNPHEALKGSLVSTGGYKGWGFGLMAEVLAAAVTGSVASLDVKGLKLPDGPPHNLGQFYFLLQPTVLSGDRFWTHLEQLSEAVGAQPGARLPGSQRPTPETVEVDATLWARLQAVAS